jgi:hypothetical protein
MDLIRTRRLFDNAALDEVLEASFAFTQTSGLRERWKAFKGKEDDALGFWAEALYHLCLAKPNPQYRAWLAEAMIDLEDNGCGLSPSLLGANAEASPPNEQWPCPIPADIRLRLANLSRAGMVEIVVVNPTNAPISLEWEKTPSITIAWRSGHDAIGPAIGPLPRIPPRGWLHGIKKYEARVADAKRHPLQDSSTNL